ncbi:MAG TPA: 7TM diverse intracellular signaling domain-containing protein [Phnomibacter sp.]|nr:7TM diverse intracellular signaling domain-containing protein [Phnomibacter sp.]
MAQLFTLFYGVLIAQLLYVAANGLQYRRADYGWYFLYQLLLLVYFGILGADDVFGANILEAGWEIAFLSIRGLAFAGYAVYFHFVQSFLHTLQINEKLHYGIQKIARLLWMLSVVFLVWEQASGRTSLGSTVYFVLSLCLFTAIIWLIARLWKNPTPLSRYILRGAIMLASGAFITNILIIAVNAGWSRQLHNYYLLPLMAGILAEIFYFNNGLTYKSRQTERELIASQQQLIEELQQKEQLQNSLLNLKQRINRDLHDELGSGLSSIRLLTDAAMARHNHQPEVQKLLQNIGNTARTLGGNINEIIWAGNQAKDNLESLLLFTRQYAADYLEQAGITLYCQLPDAQDIPAIMLPGQWRRHLFLVVKEALHNVVKHAGASQVHMYFNGWPQTIEIIVADDGCGIPTAKAGRGGNGLTNMQQRTETELNGQFIINTGNQGTSITIQVPLPAAYP